MVLFSLYGLSVVALLAAELREHVLAQRLFKPLAALGFVLLSLQSGALESDYGLLILAGLMGCAVGDLFLLSRKSEIFFKMGMSAFALGHIFYILAATHIARDPMPPLLWFGSSLLGLILAWGVFLSLRPFITQTFLWPVGIYIFIISVMLIKALQTDPLGHQILIIPGAFLFAFSDVFVARDRFVMPSRNNAWLITPCYFAAQALLALSVTV